MPIIIYGREHEAIDFPKITSFLRKIKDALEAAAVLNGK